MKKRKKEKPKKISAKFGEGSVRKREVSKKKKRKKSYRKKETESSHNSIQLRLRLKAQKPKEAFRVLKNIYRLRQKEKKKKPRSFQGFPKTTSTQYSIRRSIGPTTPAPTPASAHM